MDVVQSRLETEYDMDLIMTAPSVVYQVGRKPRKKSLSIVTALAGVRWLGRKLTLRCEEWAVMPVGNEIRVDEERSILHLAPL